MQLKSGLTLPNGQKHQKMCVCKSNHSIYGKTMIFQVLSILFQGWDKLIHVSTSCT